MKSICCLIAGLALLLSSCSKGEEIIVVKAGVRFSPTLPVTFTSDGGTREVAVKTNQKAWSVVSDQEWCKVARKESVVVITVARSMSKVPMPQATITVTAGENDDKATATLNVNQEGVPPTDLSRAGIANCYIVSAPGDYRFNAGLQGKTGKPTTDDLAVCTADWVWMTQEGILTVEPQLMAGGYIRFETPQTLIPGNVSLALVRDGKIMWTWHIWVTDKVAKSEKTLFMNINLGATSDKPGSVESLGVFYQWGRKDPMIGAAGVGDYTLLGTANEQTPFAVGNENGVAYTASSVMNQKWADKWKVDQTKTPFTNETAAAAPTTFIGPAGSMPTYSARTWPTEADPCPVGWHVPTYPEYLTNFGTNWEIDFSKYQGCVNDGVYWPATGNRHTYMPAESNGRLYFAGKQAMYWSGSQRQYTGFAYGIGFDQKQVFDEDFMISYGLPVRCIQDAQ